MKHIPKHIAVIMDGNGRWAEKRGENRIKGHIKGVKSVKIVVEEAARTVRKVEITSFVLTLSQWSPQGAMWKL